MSISADDPRLRRVAFAKLSGPGVNYLVKKYEIIMGRRSKSTPLDVMLGDHMNISRQHAKIVYNFAKKIWEIHAIGKNGVDINGKLVMPDNGPRALRSQDKIGIADRTFYFLLPKPITAAAAAPPAKLSAKPQPARKRSQSRAAGDGAGRTTPGSRGKRRKHAEEPDQPYDDDTQHHELAQPGRTKPAAAERPKIHQDVTRKARNAAVEEFQTTAFQRAGQVASLHNNDEEHSHGYSDDDAAPDPQQGHAYDFDEDEDEEEQAAGDEANGYNGHVQYGYERQSDQFDDDDDDDDDEDDEYGGYSNGG